ncbi:hypothetical protein [Qipengyuania flava]|uniref:hypothetical protein n=1 Tax=Qipengyuania flava TaxID=192812 RepID=UPI001C63907A|nr:hypothetical protein [Qipengyuania flava]QYJ06748.1 hypothetical protein KUV82_11880 [Qipengyuania flava]
MKTILPLGFALLCAAMPAAAEDAGEISLTGAEATARAIGFALDEAPPQASSALAAAQAAIAASGHAVCEGGTGRLVALDAPDGVTQVYRLSMPADDTAVFAGGHLRVRVAADGSASEVERIGASCQLIDWDPADPDIDLGVAYLQRPGADRPDPVDLWLSSRIPFAVGVVTPPFVWPLIGGMATSRVEADPDMIEAMTGAE